MLTTRQNDSLRFSSEIFCDDFPPAETDDGRSGVQLKIYRATFLWGLSRVLYFMGKQRKANSAPYNLFLGSDDFIEQKLSDPDGPRLSEQRLTCSINNS